MTSIDHLLPEPDQAPRCTEHRRALAIDPGGTAIRADRVVLVATSLPWPKPVFNHQHLNTIAPILKQSVVATRTLAYVPEVDSSPFDEQLGPLNSAVIAFDRATGQSGAQTGPVVERRFAVKDQAELEQLATALAADDREVIDAMAGSVTELVTPVVLVCTQGSHDVCCGSEGARFAAEAEAMAGVTTYRVSHTGGHRFAPTAMTLPDGRMWADLDIGLLRQILARTGETSEVVDYCRGWWGAETGPAQLAERAVFAQLGWDVEDTVRTVSVGQPVDGTTVCTVSDGRNSWTVPVTTGRSVPTIACRQPGGLPAKTAVEYHVGPVTENR